MARRLTIQIILLGLMAFAFGCGVKSPPLPSSELSPNTVGDLRAVPKAQGVEVTMTVPQASKPSRRVVQVRLYYGYLPLSGDPNCPPCPPRLRKYHTFDLTGDDASLMEGGKFTYLDRQAPLGKQAIYRAMLKDASGRVSNRSNLVRVPRVMPLPAPKGLMAKPDDMAVHLSWQGEDGTSGEADGLAGYVVYRKGPAEDKQLNMRPLLEPKLVDRTVQNGQQYSYRVAAVDRVGKHLIYGEQSKPVSVKPQDATAPKPPSDLVALPQAGATLLRFTPSPDQDTEGYLVFRSRSKTGPWTQLNQKLVIENTFMDDSVQKGVTYFYRVMAVDENGNKSKMSQALEVAPYVK